MLVSEACRQRVMSGYVSRPAQVRRTSSDSCLWMAPEACHHLVRTENETTWSIVVDDRLILPRPRVVRA